MTYVTQYTSKHHMTYTSCANDTQDAQPNAVLLAFLITQECTQVYAMLMSVCSCIHVDLDQALLPSLFFICSWQAIFIDELTTDKTQV